MLKRLSCVRSVAAAALFTVLTAGSAAATDQIYFASSTNVTNLLVQHINAETVRVDISCWYLTERSISIALINRWKAGVQVRLIGDRGSIFEIDQATRNEFYWLASQGLPIRLRYNPTWFPEIDHWKTTIFAGQKLIAIGSGNYTPFELAPWSATNFKDEIFLFTDDPALVGAVKTKFDRLWNDTTAEPDSLVPNPPYFRNWDQACASESVCADYTTQYPSRVPMSINTARLEPDNPLPSDIVWGQGPRFNNRLVQEIQAETSAVDLVSYRLTVPNITDALIAKFASGVPTRLIIEPLEYLNRKWPEFTLTHAYLDKIWAAGVPIKQRKHDGLTHMKVLITSRIATIASSNFAAAWQRDIDYFMPAATKSAAWNAVKARFNAMWTDTVNFTDFTPLAPDAPVLASPPGAAGGVTTQPTLVWNTATFAVSYDVYLGASASAMSRVGNVPAQLVNNPPTTYSWTSTAALATGTTYFWKVVSRTNATPRDPTLVASSPTWSFTTTGTAGTPPPPPPPPPSSVPSPWATQDVGAVGAAGSATYAAPTFTVTGGGADIWGTADAFRYVYQTQSGDGQIVARVASVQNTNAFAKAGVMLRESVGAGAAHAVLDVRPDGSVEFMTRSSNGAETTYLAGAFQTPPTWLKLARSGSTVTASVSANGSTWTTVGSTPLSIAASATIGLIVSSHDTATANTSTFDNVTVSSSTTGTPPPPPPPPPPSVPSPWISQDVGSTGLAGSASASNGSFTVKGAGADIWGAADAFHYVYQPLGGDGQIVARVSAVQNTNAFAKAGVMLRDTTAAGSPHVVLDVRPDGSVEFMTRSSSGGATAYIAGGSQVVPAWLKLARSGSTVTGSVSANGSNWIVIGSTTLAASSATVGLIVGSHDTSVLNTSAFDNVSVSAGATTTPPPPPPPTLPANVVIYASDIPASGRHGSWTAQSDATSPNGTKLVTSDLGVANTSTALATPADYVDVTFTASAGTPYTIWLRVKALTDSKFNDSLWLQFSDAQVNGSAIYPMQTTSGLLVNLANDGTGASISGWGWQNAAYWLSQAATVTFPTSGSHTMRIQVREDGVQFDQIVLSPSQYSAAPPGPVARDNTIVPKP